MSSWYSDNEVFVWTLVIAICVIVFGAVYSRMALYSLNCSVYRILPLDFR